MVREPLQQSDRPKDFQTQLSFAVRLSNDIAALQKLLVDVHLFLGRHQPHDCLCFWQEWPRRCRRRAPKHTETRRVASRSALSAEPYALFGSSKQVWLDELEQLFAKMRFQSDDRRGCPTHAACIDGCAEVLHEGGMVAEEAGLREVKECPEVLQRVLHRSACEENAALGTDLPHSASEQRVDASHHMRFVANDNIPSFPRWVG
mmetsp:Transcript_91932/g.192234  ORF Transcript_91932/g.192234 Transcript_91932/m.192234 type:complete len:204 (+) Transcript_91932:2695-3306(+)